jgi:hypothetical protein
VSRVDQSPRSGGDSGAAQPSRASHHDQRQTDRGYARTSRVSVVRMLTNRLEASMLVPRRATAQSTPSRSNEVTTTQRRAVSTRFCAISVPVQPEPLSLLDTQQADHSRVG